MYRLADGSAEVGRYRAGADVGEGARWTPDRQLAWRLKDGKVVAEIPLEEAEQIAASLGLPVPASHGPQDGAEDGDGAEMDGIQRVVARMDASLELSHQLSAMALTEQIAHAGQAEAAPQVPVAG